VTCLESPLFASARGYHSSMGVEPTELAGVADSQTEAVYAWSLDDEDDDLPAPRLTPRRITAASIAGALTLVAVAGAVALAHLREPVPLPAVAEATVVVATPELTPRPVVPPAPIPAAARVPASTMKPPPPPPPVAAPPAVTPQIAAYDQQFIANLRANLWTIWDPSRIAEQGHWVCAKLEQGLSPYAVSQLLFGITPGEQQSFVSTAMATYPNCP